MTRLLVVDLVLKSSTQERGSTSQAKYNHCYPKMKKKHHHHHHSKEKIPTERETTTMEQTIASESSSSSKKRIIEKSSPPHKRKKKHKKTKHKSSTIELHPPRSPIMSLAPEISTDEDELEEHFETSNHSNNKPQHLRESKRTKNNKTTKKKKKNNDGNIKRLHVKKNQNDGKTQLQLQLEPPNEEENEGGEGGRRGDGGSDIETVTPGAFADGGGGDCGEAQFSIAIHDDDPIVDSTTTATTIEQEGQLPLAAEVAVDVEAALDEVKRLANELKHERQQQQEQHLLQLRGPTPVAAVVIKDEDNNRNNSNAKQRKMHTLIFLICLVALFLTVGLGVGLAKAKKTENKKENDTPSYPIIDPEATTAATTMPPTNPPTIIGSEDGGAPPNPTVSPTTTTDIPNPTVSPTPIVPRLRYCGSNDDETSSSSYCWEQIGISLESQTPQDGFGQFISLATVVGGGGGGSQQQGITTRIAVSAPYVSGSNGPNGGLISVYDIGIGNYEEEWKKVGNEIVGNSFESVRGILSGNGERLVVIIPSTYDLVGSVIVYELLGDGWIRIGDSISAEDGDIWGDFGENVAVDFTGDTVAIGSPFSFENPTSFGVGGSVKVYRWDSDAGTWNVMGNQILGDSSQDERFGFNVALSANGTILATSTYFYGDTVGNVKIFEYRDDSWIQTGRVDGDGTSGVFFSEYFSFTPDGAHFAADASSGQDGNMPRTLVYQVGQGDDNTWHQVGSSLKASIADDYTYGVALAGDGRRVATIRELVSGSTTAYVYVFDLSDDGDWVQVGGTILVENFEYGGFTSMKMSLDGNRVAVGGTRSDGSGFVQVFNFVELAKQPLTLR